jgi:magnesium-transporting ATPase (P-type)
MIILFCFELVMIIISAILRYYYLLIFDSKFILFYKTKLIDASITMMTYFILLNTMIPISLVVSIEIIKSIQGYFINNDKIMHKYINGKKIGSKAFRSSLNEELGMI